MTDVTRDGQTREPTEWETDGIEGEHRFVTLLYNEPAGVLIAQFERMVAGGRYPVRSIYMKRTEDPRYTKVFGADDLSSAHCIVAASKRSVAFLYVHVASVDRWREDTPGMGFDWSHIARIDLLTGSVTTVIDAAAFQENHDAWISDLVSADEDGEALLCRIGMRRTLADGASTEVDYSLCRLILATSHMQIIAPLRQVFF